ncbi:MAG: DinB family protein [Phycisphaeraceae bacterium]|nr:DinB family protein [Phycisphaeraceae bacterium]
MNETRVLVGAILNSWAAQRDYAARLTADLSDADMRSQPVPGVVMNHPAWVFSHLSLYPPVLTAILRGANEGEFADPIKSPFGKDSRPVSDRAAYLPKQELLAAYFAGHDGLAQALEGADASALARPIPLKRWEKRFPLVADALVHLMLDHEAGHLGQVSAWRRAGGRAAV